MTKSTFIQNLIAERGTINAIELAQECIWAGYGEPAKRHLTRIGEKSRHTADGYAHRGYRVPII